MFLRAQNHRQRRIDAIVHNIKQSKNKPRRDEKILKETNSEYSKLDVGVRMRRLPGANTLP